MAAKKDDLKENKSGDVRLKGQKPSFIVQDFDANDVFVNNNVQATTFEQEPVEVPAQKQVNGAKEQTSQEKLDALKKEDEFEDEKKPKILLNADEKVVLGFNIAGLAVCAVFAFIFLVLVM